MNKKSGPLRSGFIFYDPDDAVDDVDGVDDVVDCFN